MIYTKNDSYYIRILNNVQRCLISKYVRSADSYDNVQNTKENHHYSI